MNITPTPVNISLIFTFICFITALISITIVLINRARKKTLEAIRKGQPINKRGTLITVAFLLCVLFVFIYMIATTQEEGINNITSLTPGSHFVDRPPFIVNVDHNEVAIITKYFWYYDITYHKVTVIPEGSFGFKYFNRNGIRSGVILQPGMHTIDPDKYEVEIFKMNMDPQTFVYGDKEWDGDRRNKH